MTKAAQRASGMVPMVPGIATGLKNVAATPISLTGTTSSSTAITAASVTAGYVANGAYITGSGIPAGTYLSGVVGAALTLSAAATASASGVALTIFPLNTRITTANTLVVADAYGNANLLQNVNASASINNSGAGGLDTGVVAASTWYYEYIIWGIALGVSKVFSLSAVAPNLPAGYTMYAWVGAARTDANKILLYTLKTGRKNQYICMVGSNVAALPLMSSGAVGAPDTPTYLAVSVSSFVPPTATEIDLVMKAGNTSAHAICAPNNSYGNATSVANTPPMAVCISSYGLAPITMRNSMILESTNIYYANSDSSNGVLVCAGWTDNL